MNVADAKDIARSWTASPDQLRDAARALLVETERLETRIAAWDEVLETCLPALREQMTPERKRWELP